MAKLPQDYRLTCNRIFRHLTVYGQQNFTGRLHIPAPEGDGWDIYMTWGKLTWATGGLHPKRRWRRQHYLATGATPNFANIDTSRSLCWDYLELSRLSMGTLSASQASRIIHGTLQEILFDLIQTFEQPFKAFVSDEEPLTRISVLSGIGDGMQVQAEEGVLPSERHRFPPTWMMPIMDLQRELQAAWEEWVKLGLFSMTPNEAPVIQDAERLRARTSDRVFANMSTLLNGQRTFRDVALKIKNSADQFGGGRALAGYIRKGYVTAKTVSDISVTAAAIAAPPRSPRGSLPIVVCLDSNAKQLEFLESLICQAGFGYEGITHAYEALYKLSQDWFPQPSLIFLSDSLPLLPYAEACRLLQRVERLRQVPIVVFSPESRSPQVRLEAESAGVADYLYGENFTRKRILSRLYTYSCRTSGTGGLGSGTLDINTSKLTVA